MKHVFVAVMIGGAVLAARPACGQSVAPAGKLSIGGAAGVGAVQNVGPTAAGTLTVRLTDRIEAIGEGVWMKDVAPRRRIETAETVAAYLQTSQGKSASGTLEIAAVFTGAGARIMLTRSGHIRPYVAVTAGVARLTLRPAFVLSGANVTTSLPQYGVTLGSDLTGETTKPAFTGGFGVLVDQGRWYIDAGGRVTSIQTEGQAIKVLRAGGGIWFKF